jgi:hypothetical protein
VAWAKKIRLAQAKAQSLEQVAAAAKRAGAATAGNLAAEAAHARQAATEEKPLHVRLERVEERLAVAAAKVDAAQDALEQAQKQTEQAGQHLRAVQLEKTPCKRQWRRRQTKELRRQREMPPKHFCRL